MGNLNLPTSVPSISIGGRVMTDLANLIILKVSASASQYGTFRKGSAAGGYQVTAGKTLTIVAIHMEVLVAMANVTANLGYGDTDVGFNSASGPTNSVNDGVCGSIATVGTLETSNNFQIPAGKYPFFSAGSTARVWATIYGYES